MSERHAALTSLPPILPRLIRRFAVVIVLLWLGFTAFVNLAVPQLEVVGKAHSVSMSPSDAASIQAIKRVGQVFGEFDSDNAVTIVLEGDQPLGGDAHRFYSDLMRKLSADTRHVAHIQDFWGDPLTAAGSQSADDRPPTSWCTSSVTTKPKRMTRSTRCGTWWTPHRHRTG